MIDETSFLPVIGYPLAQKKMVEDLNAGRITFEEACAISVMNSAIYAGTLMISAQTNYASALHFQRVMQFAYNPAVIGTIALAAGTHMATKPGATYEVDHYGSIRVMPKLGIF